MTRFSINLVRRQTVSGEYDSGGEENRRMLDKSLGAVDHKGFMITNYKVFTTTSGLSRLNS